MGERPFLFLGIRAEDDAADDEFAAVVRCAGLPERRWRRVRLERDALGEVDAAAYAGIVLGGGPYNVTDPEDAKSPDQRRAEAELSSLLDQVVAADLPFLGACYGIGTLGRHQRAVVDRAFPEPVGAAQIHLTDEGRADAVLGVLPDSFWAFLGHKEGISRLPDHAVRLAASDACPVQAFRVGRHVYATQFHPELDLAGLRTRVEVYKHHGYFAPEEAEELVAIAAAHDVTHPPLLLQAFAERYAGAGATAPRGR